MTGCTVDLITDDALKFIEANAAHPFALVRQEFHEHRGRHVDGQAA